MIRVCPERDAVCPHGMACPYAAGPDSQYRCTDGWRAPPAKPVNPRDTAISQLQAEIARYREALKPFAADKFPCSRRTKIAYNEWGLRCLMSDMEIARMAARAALGGSNDKA